MAAKIKPTSKMAFNADIVQEKLKLKKKYNWILKLDNET